MSDISIERIEASGPPVFRLSSSTGQIVRLFEITVTMLGEDEPSWRVVHELAILDNLSEVRLIAEREAKGARVASLRFIDDAARERAAIPVAELRYGDVPSGMRQVGEPGVLESNRLYEILVSGNGSGELQFYA